MNNMFLIISLFLFIQFEKDNDSAYNYSCTKFIDDFVKNNKVEASLISLTTL